MTLQDVGHIDLSGLPGNPKLWWLQFGLLPRPMWPLTMYEVPLSKIEKLEKMINSFIRNGVQSHAALVAQHYMIKVT